LRVGAASEYRKAFYDFERDFQGVEINASQYNLEFQKNLNIKTQNILDWKGMAYYFERQLFRLTRNPKQVRKNWSEDETLLLLSIMAYFCSQNNEEFMHLV
jgi:YHS domain-containing protein